MSTIDISCPECYVNVSHSNLAAQYELLTVQLFVNNNDTGLLFSV